MIISIVKLVRPHQWVKNIVIFAAVIFSKNFFNLQYLERSIIAFGVFCVASGAVYIFNDIIDARADRNHPQKSRRPIAAGDISLAMAIIYFVVMFAGAVVLSYFIFNIHFFKVVSIYILLNILYSIVLKRIVILDVVIISINFVLRAVAGVYAIASTLEFSTWLIICTFFLSLFLALSKRRAEVELLEERAEKHRRALRDYSTKLLDEMIAVVTASTVMSYTLYTISTSTVEKFGTVNLVYTVPFVVFGIFRYLFLIHMRKEGGSPTRILYRDRPLIINLVLWVISCMLILY
ncbi:MAG: decaprenyl-phosphate phosphoribosyltransferase [Candidatus Coatesbacteria bacterium]|nr:MAG: decaprenyl-phosphate phosphoribosyltransferase [Candidatus Coatesbacteria bacterium]RLC42404.1 MAG: decaprenyl-phosphate phosphoribosyltransferase [Candidatus Coatesbacteria bacterium]RLC42802.1 MAG: decaprenyl-phosphate phosphoribosyltransferase [Candidatus Coatesbacteria bacterium]